MDRLGHGQVGFSGAGRADPEDDGVGVDGVDIPLLVERLGRIVFPRRDRMSRVSTSAGDSLPAPTSIATLWRTTSGVNGCPLATIATSSETARSAMATSAGSPARVTVLPRTCRLAVKVRSSALKFSSAEPSKPTTRSGGTSMLLRT
ncbi:phoH-like domain protein [Mycobacterium ulcerans str. Harvey]|uniref:PhoH-like domain protein n=1 Tax=Mycobacterium ulcerans str. Harvey TaxID=1299332 RepID=A0ABP3A877_MYCUL|nr:phoH-like domain protein [Mycobacterium ulcerans str. Harvey]